MAAILPEKFEQGDFRVWLRQFEVCADANGWTEPQRLRKLPAFLRGLAATHFYALTDEQRDTYQNLLTNLTAALCPAICRETYYTEFGERMLRNGEDSSMSCAATATPVPAESPSEPEPVVQELISAVKDLQVQQKVVVAALSAEKQRPNIKQQQPSSSSSPMQRQFICYFCNEPGHIARNCPRKPQFQCFGGQQRP
eukprot:gene1355-1496_t